MKRLFDKISHITTSLALEQAVYGSFAFREGGYDVLASSKGCRANWLSSLRLACERYGEPARGSHAPAGLFSLRVDRATRMIVGPSDQGIDDQGRPRALAFHALFISKEDEKQIDFDPFALAPFLKRSWPSDTPRELPKLTVSISAAPRLKLDDRARSIARSLRKGKRVAIGANEPIDDLARAVWNALPIRNRRAKSVASWAFSLGNRFDLAALPESSPELLEADAEYVGPFEEHATGEPPLRWRPWILFVSTLALLLSAVAYWRGLPAKNAAIAPPDRAAFQEEVVTDSDRENIAGALRDFALNTEVFDPKHDAIDDSDPTAWMILIADRLRYRGAFLAREELEQIDAISQTILHKTLSESARERDGRLRRFIADRPLPADFKRVDAPLRWKLAVFAWSYHLDPKLAKGPPKDAVLKILAELTDPESPDVSESWKQTYPQLREQERFLKRLPLP